MVGISTTAFASLDECIKAGASKYDNSENIIKYCKPFEKKNIQGSGILLDAYVAEDEDKKALDLSLWVIKNFSKEKTPYLTSSQRNKVYTNTLGAIGDIYYFGGKDVPINKKLGMKYTVQAAELGNAIAQNQLGEFYNSPEDFPGLNGAISYKWYMLAIENGSSPARSSALIKDIDFTTKQGPLCIAMGKQLLAEAYIDGKGVSVNKARAERYLRGAIVLYKNNKVTEDSFKYCPTGADKLNLASAEKELDSL